MICHWDWDVAILTTFFFLSISWEIPYTVLLTDSSQDYILRQMVQLSQCPQVLHPLTQSVSRLLHGSCFSKESGDVIRCVRKFYVNTFLFYLRDPSIHELGESKYHFLKDREERPHKHS